MGEILFKDKNEVIEEIKPDYDKNKSLSENAKEVVKFSATVNTLKDDKFVESVESEIKETIIGSVKAEKKIESIEKESRILDSESIKASSYYNKHKAVLEFGGLDKASVISVMKLTFYLMVMPYFLTAVLIKTPIRIISTFFDEFNKLLICIGNFSKPAKLFCQFVIWTSIGVSLIMLVVYGVQYIFKIKII